MRANEHVLGQYRLLERIGQGGMAEVYHARHLTDDTQEVAVKVIRTDLTENETVSRRFLREVKATSTAWALSCINCLPARFPSPGIRHFKSCFSKRTRPCPTHANSRQPCPWDWSKPCKQPWPKTLMPVLNRFKTSGKPCNHSRTQHPNHRYLPLYARQNALGVAR
jgi:serine/threonine protein kinase